MRTLFAAALALLVASAALADDAVAGKTHILMSSPQNAYWVPLGGGPGQLIFTGHGGATSVASDGERFLIATGSSVSIYEEGASQPLRTIDLDEVEAQSRSYAIWDGNRYVVAWVRPNDHIHVAALSADGTVLTKVALDSGIQLSGLAANGDRVLLLEDAVLPPFNPPRRRLRAFLLNHDLRLARITMLGEVPEIDLIDASTFQKVA